MLKDKALGKYTEYVACLNPEFVYSRVVEDKMVRRLIVNEEITIKNTGRKGKREKAEWHRRKVGLFARKKGCQLCGARIKYFMLVYHTKEDTHSIYPIVVNDEGKHYELTIDHIIPKSKGGASDFINYAALCKKCNSVKKDIIMHQGKETFNIQMLKSYILQFGLMDDITRESYLDIHRKYMARRYLDENLDCPGEIDSVDEYLQGLGGIVNQMDLTKVKFEKLKRVRPVL